MFRPGGEVMVVDNRGKPHGDGPTPLKLTDGTKGRKGKGKSIAANRRNTFNNLESCK